MTSATLWPSASRRISTAGSKRPAIALTADIGRGEAHALLFGKPDHVEMERQPPAAAVELLDHHEAGQDAEPAVVVSGIDHRVVVRADDQRLGGRIGGRIAADDIADGIDPRRHAGRRHPVAQLRGHRPVRRRQIGAGQAVRRLGEFRQPRAPARRCARRMRRWPPARAASALRQLPSSACSTLRSPQAREPLNRPWRVCHGDGTGSQAVEDCCIVEVVLTEWLSVIIRWLHVVAGIAWIGSSFYFIHLDLSLKADRACRRASRATPGRSTAAASTT